MKSFASYQSTNFPVKSKQINNNKRIHTYCLYLFPLSDPICCCSAKASFKDYDHVFYVSEWHEKDDKKGQIG